MCFRIPYEDLDTGFKTRIQELCTVRMKPTEYEPTPATYYCFRVLAEEKEIAVPLGIWREFYTTFPNDSLRYAPAPRLVFSGRLYSIETDPRHFRDQQSVADQALATLRDSKVVFLNLATGWGKTVTAIYLAATLKTKTLVLCHFRVVVNQWRRSFARHTPAAIVQNLNEAAAVSPDADVYVVGIKRCLKLIEADPTCFDGLGCVVVDEAHVATVAAFVRCLPRLPPPRYLIGLTATPERSDRLDSLFVPYFGSAGKHIVRLHVKPFEVVKFQTDLKPDIRYTLVRGKTVLNWSHLQNSLAYNSERNRLIADVAGGYPDRVILILCGRIKQAQAIHDLLVARHEKVALFSGSAQDYDKEARILVAGAKKAGVGFDNSTFTMLILAFDAKDVRQFEGRIRTDHNVVVDLVDDNKTLEKHWRIRKKWYTRRGAQFRTVRSIDALVHV